MNIEDFNHKFIERYLSIPKELRSLNSYPFLISLSCSSHARHVVPIYFKQPQDWLSSYYDVDLTSDKLYELLMSEYNENLLFNRAYKPIKLFIEYKNRLQTERLDIDIVYNNLIKFSRNSNKGLDPDTYDGKFTDQFNDLLEEEYKIIEPHRSVFCIGPNKDYTGLMSWKILNDIDINPLKERPFGVYKDKMGNEVLHTYHPNYWHSIKDTDLKEIVYKFIIGEKIEI